MRISLSTPVAPNRRPTGTCRMRIAVAMSGSVAAVLAFGGVATAQPLPVPIDPLAVISSIAEPAKPALYNAAQDNLVKGEYDVGLASLDALALAAPSDPNVAALQAFYRNAADDPSGRDAALERLGSIDPAVHDSVDRAIGIITTSAESPVDYAPVFDGRRTAIVALGFGLENDGSMRDELVQRLESAAAAAQTSPESPIVVTGGNPQNGTAEADAMRDWLVGDGIDESRIHVEDAADSTVQNALLSQPILDSIGVNSIVIATSDNHVRRAASDFGIAGSTVIGAATVDAQSPPAIAALGPDSRLGLTVDATKVVGIPRTY